MSSRNSMHSSSMVISLDEIHRARSTLYLKGFVIGIVFVSLYVGLLSSNNIFLSSALIVAFALTSVAAAINVGHDAVHGSLSREANVNNFFLWVLDCFGINGALWRYRHIQHHRYPNLSLVDPDLETGGLIRFDRSSPVWTIHRYQHFYAWFLYLFGNLKLQFWDEFVFLGRGRVGFADIRAVRRALIFRSLAGKAILMAWAIAIPSIFHSLSDVLLAFFVAQAIIGVTTTLLFQLAHSVEHAHWALPDGHGGDQSIDQISNTANFRTSNRFLGAFVGGLDHQIEHHLFPGLPHTALKLAAERRGSQCSPAEAPGYTYPSIWSALLSHGYFLRAMGKAHQQ